MNQSGQRRSNRKQKNKAKMQKQRTKMTRRSRNDIFQSLQLQQQQQQRCCLDRPMNVSEVITTISMYVEQCILKNEQKPRRRPSFSSSSSVSSFSIRPSIFNDPDLVNVSVPSLERIHNYVKMIFEKRRLAAETGVVGFVLLLRTNIKITAANWMRLVMVSLLLANKEAEDVYNVWNVRFVGIIPNLQVYEINLLEMEFLQHIQYRLHVEPITYQSNYDFLLSYLPPLSTTPTTASTATTVTPMSTTEDDETPETSSTLSCSSDSEPTSSNCSPMSEEELSSPTSTSTTTSTPKEALNTPSTDEGQYILESPLALVE